MTTFLGANIISFPVAGFLPRRSAFCFTQKRPKPEINTSSPDSSVDFMSSSKVSMVSTDFRRVKPLASITASTMWALVSVPLKGIKDLLSRGSLHITDKGLICQLKMNIQEWSQATRTLQNGIFDDPKTAIAVLG